MALGSWLLWLLAPGSWLLHRQARQERQQVLVCFFFPAKGCLFRMGSLDFSLVGCVLPQHLFAEHCLLRRDCCHFGFLFCQPHLSAEPCWVVDALLVDVLNTHTEHAQSKPRVNPEHAPSIHGTSPEQAQSKLKACSKQGQVSPEHAQSEPRVSPEHAQNKPRACPEQGQSLQQAQSMFKARPK